MMPSENTVCPGSKEYPTGECGTAGMVVKGDVVVTEGAGALWEVMKPGLTSCVMVEGVVIGSKVVGKKPVWLQPDTASRVVAISKIRKV